MPNVMKVYLENGQTKSFKYDSATTVADVLNSLQQKLGFKSMDHFSLCVEHVKSIRKNKLTLLDPAESLAWVCHTKKNLNFKSQFFFRFASTKMKYLNLNAIPMCQCCCCFLIYRSQLGRERTICAACCVLPSCRKTLTTFCARTWAHSSTSTCRSVQLLLFYHIYYDDGVALTLLPACRSTR